MATITAASRKPLRAADAGARAGAGWVDTFAVRTEPFIGKCLNLSANAAGEQSRGTTRPPRGTSRPGHAPRRSRLRLSQGARAEASAPRPAAPDPAPPPSWTGTARDRSPLTVLPQPGAASDRPASTAMTP